CVDTRATPNEHGVPCRFFGVAGQSESTFSFGSLPAGTAYNITVKTQPFGKICTVTHASGVLGASDSHPIVTCVNDHDIPRYPLTATVAPAVAAIPSAKVILTTEDGIREASAYGATNIVFPSVLFDSGTQLPVFKWSVTATSAEDGAENNCDV